MSNTFKCPNINAQFLIKSLTRKHEDIFNYTLGNYKKNEYKFELQKKMNNSKLNHFCSQ